MSTNLSLGSYRNIAINSIKTVQFKKHLKEQWMLSTKLKIFKRCFIASTFQQNILDSLKLQTLADLLLKMQNLIQQVLELKMQRIHSLLRLKDMLQFRHSKQQKN